MLAVPVGEGLALAEGEGQGVAEALGLGEVEAASEAEAAGEAEVEAFADALALVAGLLELDAETQTKGGVGRVRRMLFTFWPLPPPLSSRAAGTTISPMTTVMTKAAAPHSRRQNPALELRIRALRPGPVGAYSSC